MPRYNTPSARPATSSAVQSFSAAQATTFEGAPGYARDEKSELFLLAVAHMGDGSFYESSQARDERLRSLVRAIAPYDKPWITSFATWLRSSAQMRTASIVIAAEAAKVLLEHGTPGARQVIATVLRRADEPGELIAYWTQRFGRTLPHPVKNGINDAVRRLYSEYSLLKYDTDSHGYRFGDVIELTHPVPMLPWQDDLFKIAIDRRHGRDNVVPASLTMLNANAALRATAAQYPEILLSPDRLKEAGFTWEDALSLAGNKVPKDKLWEAVIPSMGYMALLRNLRNFDQAGVPDSVAMNVGAKLADPGEVARSRQFPFRFLSAYNAVPSLRWAYPLELALGHSLANVPGLKGSTLILVDRSGSMFGPISARTGLNRADQAALFGVALALRGEFTDLVQFGSSSERVDFIAGSSVLPLMREFRSLGGTYTRSAVERWYRNQDRVICITDEQAAYDGSHGVYASVPAHVPVYTWNLAGYRYGAAPSGTGNRHVFGGMTDSAFRMIPILEAGKSADWDALFGSAA